MRQIESHPSDGEKDYLTCVPPISMISTLMPHQIEAVEWMEEREIPCREGHPGGGILADFMGLGKTVDVIACLVKSLERCPRYAPEPDTPPSCMKAIMKKKVMMNLIIVPLSLISQWKDEIMFHSTTSESHILIYHGDKRRDALRKAVENGTCFIVITTYDLVAREFSEECKYKDMISEMNGETDLTCSPLYDIHWVRIILDEAHRIRTKNNAVTKAVCALRSNRRWCVTATPFNNCINDLVTLTSFINVAPYRHAAWWQAYENNQEAITKWRKTFVLMRDKSILQLPPQHILILPITLSPEEREYYSKELRDAVDKYFRFRNSRGAERFKLYGSVLSYLIRLRQICVHPLLILGRAWTRPYSHESSAGKFLPEEMCCMCKESADDLGYLKELGCGHYVCYDCIEHLEAEIPSIDTSTSGWISYFQKVNMALPSMGDEEEKADAAIEEMIEKALLMHEVEEGGFEEIKKHAPHVSKRGSLIRSRPPSKKINHSIDFLSKSCHTCKGLESWFVSTPVTPEVKQVEKKRYSLRERKQTQRANVISHQATRNYAKRDYVLSSKMKEALQACVTVLEADPSNKIVVFSQWTGCLDIFEYALSRTEQKPKCVRYDGDVSQVHKRGNIIKEFNTDPKCRLFLSTLKCGGVGLNLCAANYVLLLDTWYNPFMEAQAIDRVHRIGQTREVTVIRFLVDSTIEVDVHRIQERKKRQARTVLTDQCVGGVPANDLVDVQVNDVHEIFRRACNVILVSKKRTRPEATEDVTLKSEEPETKKKKLTAKDLLMKKPVSTEEIQTQ